MFLHVEYTGSEFEIYVHAGIFTNGKSYTSKNLFVIIYEQKFLLSFQSVFLVLFLTDPIENLTILWV